MAYWINKYGNNNHPTWCQFYCDSDEDIANLPTSENEGVKQDKDTTAHRKCCVGSECLSLATASVYVLNSANEWKKLA